MLELNKIYNMDCLEGMKKLDDCCIDLTVTSPPYDNLRTYKGYSFDFEGIAKELFRITKDGGIVVWIVSDATIKGSETGTSFKQALFFKECGFNLHDTMIYKKISPYPPNVRYWQSFEYMFIFSKGKPKTFNPIMQLKSDKSDKRGYKKTYRQKDGSILPANEKAMERIKKANQSDYRIMDNIWKIDSGYMLSTTDTIAYKHPAIFPDKLAKNHIKSWSNVGDVVFDPFIGSGTTAKMAIETGRQYIGFEISSEYCEIIKKRLENIQMNMIDV